MTLSAAIRHAKLAKKAKQRGRQLKANAEALQRRIDQDPDRISLVVQTRENMFGEGDLENGYTLEQIAAPDAAIAAYTPEERAAVLAQARACFKFEGKRRVVRVSEADPRSARGVPGRPLPGRPLFFPRGCALNQAPVSRKVRRFEHDHDAAAAPHPLAKRADRRQRGHPHRCRSVRRRVRRQLGDRHSVGARHDRRAPA